MYMETWCHWLLLVTPMCNGCVYALCHPQSWDRGWAVFSCYVHVCRTTKPDPSTWRFTCFISHNEMSLYKNELLMNFSCLVNFLLLFFFSFFPFFLIVWIFSLFGWIFSFFEFHQILCDKILDITIILMNSHIFFMISWWIFELF